MQIERANKYIILALLLFLLPISAFSQVSTKKYYVTNIGDTTEVLMDKSGLKAEASAFLRDGRINTDEADNRFQGLKDAAHQTKKMSDDVIVLEKYITSEENVLGVEEARKNIERNKIEREIERLERKKMLFIDTSKEERAFLKEKFGDKPSYFINGMPVDENLIHHLPQKEILSRSLKVSNTITGNPNGEVWYVVTQYALDRFGLSTPDDEIAKTRKEEKSYDGRGDYFEEETSSIVDYDLLSPAQKEKLAKQQREVEELKQQINAVRKQKGLDPLPETEMSGTAIQTEISPDSRKPEKPRSDRDNLLEVVNATKRRADALKQDDTETVLQEEDKTSKQQREIEELRRAINDLRIQRNLNLLPANSVQSQQQPEEKQQDQKKSQKAPVTIKEEIVTFHDSPLEKAKQKEDTPKRSVRKIKERERNK